MQIVSKMLKLFHRKKTGKANPNFPNAKTRRSVKEAIGNAYKIKPYRIYRLEKLPHTKHL